MKLKLREQMKKLRRVKQYQHQAGITLIALVITIVVLLILAGVSINALFSDNGIIERAKNAQNKVDEAEKKDLEEINKLNNWLEENGGISNSGGEDNPSTTTPKTSTLVGTTVTKNTKAEDAYGNKITIPKGFKILAHSENTTTGDVTYNYSEDHVPAVQDGIVIENETDGNQFVWVPVGTIKNKDNTTNTITLGRYSSFTMTNGAVASGQPVQVAAVENCTQTVKINSCFQELSTARVGNSATDSTAENATARNLKEFISTTIANGGYYIARFEASGTTSKISSKYDQKVLVSITQPNAARLAREMYGEVKENNELVYASDLVNSYAWDTAIIFIQTYSGTTDYASQNKSTAFQNTGKNADKYCNIWDMSGNAYEWTTEYFTNNIDFCPYVTRGGFYNTPNGTSGTCAYYRYEGNPTPSGSCDGLRPLLYIK